MERRGKSLSSSHSESAYIIITMTNALIIENKFIELIEIFKFGKDRNEFNKSYDVKFYDVEKHRIRRFKIQSV